MRKLDLRSGRPVWSAYRVSRVKTAPLRRDIETDVLIVGMGISGAMLAESISADGHAVVGIDRRGPFLGSTSATTALVQFEIDVPLSRLAAKIGREKAERAWTRSFLAVQNLAGRIEDLGIECALTPRSSLFLAGTMLGSRGLRAESEARASAGIRSVFLSRSELAARFGIDRSAALSSHGNLALDPRKLTAGLLSVARSRRARFFAPVEAIGIDEGARKSVVRTRGGPTITARHVVLATGYELTDIVPAAAHRIVSTWAIATRPQRRSLWPQQALIWEASEPYLYLRTTVDGRVVCGGEDEDYTDEERRQAATSRKTARLSRRLKQLLPHLDARAEFAWSGSFGTTATGLPYIGSIPRHPRVHAVMGYGGNGITYSQIASELVRAAIRGERDRDAELFAFERTARTHASANSSPPHPRSSR